MKDLLAKLRESAEFKQIMDELQRNRPVIPDYRPQATREETEYLVEKIKYQSGLRDGFDLLSKLLTGK